MVQRDRLAADGPGGDVLDCDGRVEQAQEGVMNRKQLLHALYIAGALIGIILLQQLWVSSQGVRTIPYSEFLDDLHAGKIADLRVSGDYLEGDWKQPEKGTRSFVTTRVPSDLAAELERNHVRFSGEVQNTLIATLLSWVVPTLLFFGLWMFWFRRVAQGTGAGGFMSIGRSKAKVYVETNTKATFDD